MCAFLLAAETLRREDKARRIATPFNDPNQRHQQDSTDSAPMAPLLRPEIAEQGHLESSFAGLSVANDKDKSSASSNGKVEALAGAQKGGLGAPKAAAATAQGLQEKAATVDPKQRLPDVKPTWPLEPGVPDAAAKVETRQETQHSPPASAPEPAAATSQGVDLPPLWHRPALWVWTEIQDVALRVMTSLHWSFAWFQNSSQDDESHHCCRVVQGTLLRLLYDLLIGHFSDHDMKFGRVLASGLQPVLQCAALNSAQSPMLNCLVVAFLQRTALMVQVWDSMEDYERPAQGVPGFQEVPYIWQLFGEC